MGSIGSAKDILRADQPLFAGSNPPVNSAVMTELVSELAQRQYVATRIVLGPVPDWVAGMGNQSDWQQIRSSYLVHRISTHSGFRFKHQLMHRRRSTEEQHHGQ